MSAQLSDLAAERALLCALLLKNEVLYDFQERVGPESFSLRAHGFVFEAIHYLVNHGRPADLVTTAGRLTEVGKLFDVGGPAYLAQLLSQSCSPSSASDYAEKILELYLRRKTLAGLMDAVQAIQKPGDLNGDLGRIEKTVFDLTYLPQRAGLTEMTTLMPKIIGSLEARSEGRDTTRRVYTGFQDLDQMLNGLRGGQLIVIAAQPGMGKTSLALNIMLDAAVRQKKGILFFSLEMPEDEIGERMLSCLSQIDLERLLRGTLGPKEFSDLYYAAEDLEKSNFFICDKSSVTPIDALSVVRRKLIDLQRLEKPGDIDLIVVDYIQLMKSGERTEGQVAEITAVSNGLKRLAKEVGRPVIALSQLSKEGYRKGQDGESRTPDLADLKGSGSIEADADAVLMLYRQQNPGTDSRAPSECKIKIAKNRAGPTGTISLTWMGSSTKFYNFSSRDTVENNGGWAG